MTEILFILTTIYVAYVIHSITNEKTPNANVDTYKTANEEIAPVAAPINNVQTNSPPAEPLVVTPVVAPAKEKVKTAITLKPTALKSSVRDPKTGEVASATANYRFTKRWIKEALVAEGLVYKIYKNNELDADIEDAIKAALVTLATMDKYRV